MILTPPPLRTTITALPSRQKRLFLYLEFRSGYGGTFFSD
nr:MAG TPA: hypothetical protein [Bacteriophage sp.]